MTKPTQPQTPQTPQTPQPSRDARYKRSLETSPDFRPMHPLILSDFNPAEIWMPLDAYAIALERVRLQKLVRLVQTPKESPK